MARKSRRTNKAPIGPFLFAGIAILLLAVFGIQMLPKDKEASVKAFSLNSYLENCNSLRGNQYALDGEIVENTQHDPAIGKFIILRVNTEKNPVTPNHPQTVGILVPSAVTGPNLETKQKYAFVVEVKDEGALVATQYSAL